MDLHKEMNYLQNRNLRKRDGAVSGVRRVGILWPERGGGGPARKASRVLQVAYHIQG